MKNIVIAKDKKLFVSLKDIAEFSGYQLNGVIDLVNRHKRRLDINLPKGSYKVLSGLNLTERQATHLIILMKNTDEVLNFKDALIEQFFKMRDVLENQHAIIEQAQKKHIIKLQNRVYGAERGKSYETISFIKRTFEIEEDVNELNSMLFDADILDKEDIISSIFVPAYGSSFAVRSGNATLIHVDTAIKVFKALGVVCGKFDSQLIFNFDN